MKATLPQKDVPGQELLLDNGPAVPLPQPEKTPRERKKEPRDDTKPLPFKDVMNAWFSKDRAYRYALWRKLKVSGPTILFIGLNPSTADETTDDPTVARMLQYAYNWGYGDVWVGNVFAYRGAHPKILRTVKDPIGPQNDEWLEKMAIKADMILCCWGNLGRLHAYTYKPKRRSDRVRARLQAIKPLHCLRLTKRGEPHHPLYLRGDLTPVPMPVNIVEAEAEDF